MYSSYAGMGDPVTSCGARQVPCCDDVLGDCNILDFDVDMDEFPCLCDTECVAEGDCCDDYEDVCGE